MVDVDGTAVDEGSRSEVDFDFLAVKREERKGARSCTHGRFSQPTKNLKGQLMTRWKANNLRMKCHYDTMP